MDERPRKKRRFPLESEGALKENALNYLARFPCSTAKLRQHLQKKMREAVAHGEATEAEAELWINAVVETMIRVNLLDDRAYAESRARTLFRRGRSTRVITQDLTFKGIASEHIEAAIAELEEHHGDPNLAAAILLAKKRHLGPYSREALSFEKKQKDLARLARAGFSYDIARQVIDSEPFEDE